jgi:hypothetical protein
MQAARWRKCQRKSSASLFILVQIQAGPPRLGPRPHQAERPLQGFPRTIASSFVRGNELFRPSLPTTRRIVWSSQSGTPADLTDVSLARTLSSAQKASASWYFFAPKARSGLRSASIVKIENESVSLIFRFQPVSTSLPATSVGRSNYFALRAVVGAGAPDATSTFAGE